MSRGVLGASGLLLVVAAAGWFGGYGGLLRFPVWVRRFGAWASIRHAPRAVVCMERYGHSNCWAQSHMSTRTRGGVMPMGELAAVTVPEPFMGPP